MGIFESAWAFQLKLQGQVPALPRVRRRCIATVGATEDSAGRSARRGPKAVLLQESRALCSAQLAGGVGSGSCETAGCNDGWLASVPGKFPAPIHARSSNS